MLQREILIKSVALSKYFPLKKKNVFQRETQYVKANHEISLDIYKGETLGLVGESGCGKSTFGRTLIQLQHANAGMILYYGYTIFEFKPKYALQLFKKLQIIMKGYKGYKTASQQQKTLLQLCGGLLTHHDLQSVSRALLESVEEESNSDSLMVLWDEVSKNPEFDMYQSYYDPGIDLQQLTHHEMNALRNDLQIIFQNPYSSLDPRMSVGSIIAEGIQNFRKDIPEATHDIEAYIKQIMYECGLTEDLYSRYPHQFSGGQRQRVSIARTLALRPKFIVCDESVSALDVSIQAQVLKLLEKLKEDNDLTYLFISHDLGVVRYISDRIGVMYFGHLVELAPTQELFKNPLHPYTKKLLEAVPQIEFDLNDEQEEQNKPIDMTGIEFDFVYDRKGHVDSAWIEVTPGHFVACKEKPEVIL